MAAKINALPSEMMKSICEALGLKDPDTVGSLQIYIKQDRIEVSALLWPTDALGHPLTELITSTDWVRQGAHNRHTFDPTRCGECGGQIGAPAHLNHPSEAELESDDGFPTAECTRTHPAKLGHRGLCGCGHPEDAACHVVPELEPLPIVDPSHSFRAAPDQVADEPYVCVCGHTKDSDCHT